MPTNPPENVYRDTESRYLHDPEFHVAVKMLEAAAERHGFTPGELKQIAFKAALNLEMRATKPLMYVTGGSNGEPFVAREPLPLCIIGVKAQDGPPPLTIATVEEYRAYFRCDPPPSWFEPVTLVIPIAESPEPPWPAPYPEQLEPGAVLLEDAIDRSDWRKP